MSDDETWRRAIAYLCEAKGFSADRVLARPEHHDFKPTASGGAVWLFLAPDLQYGGLADQTAVLTREQYEDFNRIVGGAEQ